jgi:ankyrin repeat protein
MTSSAGMNPHIDLLYLTSCFFNLDDLQYMLEKKFVDINIQNNIGETALHKAVMINNVAACELLLRYGASVNLQDNYEWTPLHWACIKNHTEIVKLLLEYNADTSIKCSIGDAYRMAQTEEIIELFHYHIKKQIKRPFALHINREYFRNTLYDLHVLQNVLEYI